MASPVSFRVSVPPGVVVRGGRPAPPAYAPLLEQIALARPGTWLKANLNTFQSAWPDPAFLPLFGAGPSSPAAVIRAWSSFAWDDDAMRLILFGGGHANSADGGSYMWEGATCRWKLAFYSTDVELLGTSTYQSVAGSLNSPVSAHTYANQVWLPKLQRFLTFGGAQHSSGGPWIHATPEGVRIRNAGPYTLDMSLAGQNYVGAGTGTNVKRAGTLSAGVSLPGARAWANRDWNLDHPNKTLTAAMNNYINGAADITVENGHDVVYVAGAGQGSLALFRVELVDNDYHHDLVSQVGNYENYGGRPCGGAYSPRFKLFLHPPFTSSQPLGGWKLSNPGPANPSFQVAPAGIGGKGAAEFLGSLDSGKHSILWDERRNCFVVWERGARLWALKPPASLADLSAGWMVESLAGNSLSPRPLLEAEFPPQASDTSVSGKWKRARTLDVYVGLQHCFEGNVWFFKPLDWLDPRN